MGLAGQQRFRTPYFFTRQVEAVVACSDLTAQNLTTYLKVIAAMAASLEALAEGEHITIFGVPSIHATETVQDLSKVSSCRSTERRCRSAAGVSESALLTTSLYLLL